MVLLRDARNYCIVDHKGAYGKIVAMKVAMEDVKAGQNPVRVVLCTLLIAS
jgi:hypothetical protein